MNLTLLRKKILALLASGKPPGEIAKGIEKLFNQYAAPQDFKENFIADVKNQYAWIKDKGMNDSERSTITKELNRHTKNFAKAKRYIESEVKFIVGRGLRKDKPKADIKKQLVDRLGVLDYHADTITRTAEAGFSGIDTIHQADEAGIELLTYSGPPAERDFCNDLLGNTYSIDEIQAMDNGQNLPVEYYCGGYNCRHHWRAATQDEIDNYNK